MKFRSRSLLATAIALASQGALSADTYISVFLDSNPMRGLEVRLNGEEIGSTDERGTSSSFTSVGENKIELYRDGVFLTDIEYSISEDQDAEISVTFNEKRSKPEVKLSFFDANDGNAEGFVGGKITDLDGVPVVGALVSDFDGAAETTTDENGTYEFSLPRGPRTIKVSHPDFSAKVVENVLVLVDVGAAVSLKLSPRVSSSSINIEAPNLQLPVEEVLTLGSYKADDTAIGLERFSTDVIDAIDAATMSRFGDGNIASALTRLAGVAVTGGQYANVRGLDGRYISTELNGFLMPTTDPLTRDVQLDLFPSGILENIQVQKTYTSNLLGNTTGGSLQIETKGVPDERVASASLKVGGKTGITGQDILSHEGSETDWLTYDDGSRALADVVLDATGGNALESPEIDEDDQVSRLLAAGYAITFDNNYNVETKSANPDFDLGLSYGDVTDDGLYGYYASVGYGYDTSARLDATLTDPTGDNGVYERSTEAYSLDGYLVLGAQFRTEDEITSKSILLRNSEFETGFAELEDDEGNNLTQAYLQWTERNFFSQQFVGKHVFDIDLQSHELNWGLAFSTTHFYEPDRRSYTYFGDVLIQNTLQRRWLEMEEDSLDFRIDYTAPVEFSSSIFTEFKVGALVSDKERESLQYRYGWDDGDGDLAGEVVTIDQDLEEVFAYEQFVLDTYRLDVRTSVADSFDAEESVDSIFVDTSTEFGESFILGLGVRQQNFEQSLTYPNASSTSFDNSLEVESVLPAVNFTYIPNDLWQIKLAASQTVSYPGIIEQSLARNFDRDNREFTGCSDCVESQIDNFDLRFEYYFSGEESISLALFNKEIDSPMEKAVTDGSGSATSGYTYRQSQSATLNGLEIDGKLNFYDDGTWLGFVSGNVSYIESEVTLDDESLRLEGEAAQGRELQGQAPWLLNLQVGLDHFPTDQKVTLLVNHFDDRIHLVLRQPRAALIEVGRTELNLNYEANITEAIKLKSQFKNLLNEPVEFKINDNVVEAYKEGIEYSLEVKWEY